MEIIQKKDRTEEAASRIMSKRVLHFMKKENRDRAFKIIKAAGINARRTTSRGAQLHPEYVEDYEGDVEIGFGNVMYQTNFPVLYNLEIRNEIDGRRR